MWDKLLKWGKNPWVWGIAIPVGLFVFSRWGGGSAASNSEGGIQPGGLESGVLPMFITGGLGGGGANMMGGSAPLPLGGEIWQPPAVPLSENPDVRIAEIYAGVQRAAIDAQREAALRSSQLVSDSITERPVMQQPANNNNNNALLGVVTAAALSGDSKTVSKSINRASATAANLRNTAQTPAEMAAAAAATLQAAVSKNMAIMYSGIK